LGKREQDDRDEIERNVPADRGDDAAADEQPAQNSADGRDYDNGQNGLSNARVESRRLEVEDVRDGEKER
jgi:hypothetical protein